jgi:hypothetical protein
LPWAAAPVGPTVGLADVVRSGSVVNCPTVAAEAVAPAKASAIRTMVVFSFMKLFS